MVAQTLTVGYEMTSSKVSEILLLLINLFRLSESSIRIRIDPELSQYCSLSITVRPQ